MIHHEYLAESHVMPPARSSMKKNEGRSNTSIAPHAFIDLMGARKKLPPMCASVVCSA